MATSAEKTDADPALLGAGPQDHFPVERALQRTVDHVRAVDGVSWTTRRDPGLVGESGCGKTTVGRTVLRLVPATSGEVVFDGKEVFRQDAANMRMLRREMQIIFQIPGFAESPHAGGSSGGRAAAGPWSR